MAALKDYDDSDLSSFDRDTNKDPLPRTSDGLKAELDKMKTQQANAVSLITKLTHWPIRFYDLGEGFIIIVIQGVSHK